MGLYPFAPLSSPIDCYKTLDFLKPPTLFISANVEKRNKSFLSGKSHLYNSTTIIKYIFLSQSDVRLTLLFNSLNFNVLVVSRKLRIL